MIVCLEGPHGTGKTTLTKKLSERGFIGIYDERPNPCESEFAREMFNIFKFKNWWIEAIRNNRLDSIVVIERHPKSILLYTEYFYSVNRLSQSEYYKILRAYNVHLGGFACNLTLKLDISFEELCRRIKIRNRQGFNEESVEYNRKIYDMYKKYEFPLEEKIDVDYDLGELIELIKSYNDKLNWRL